jgi:outer membrane protein TolC
MVALLVGATAFPTSMRAQSAPVDTLTLEQALAAGQAANARLLLSRIDERTASTRVAEARGALLPDVSVQGRLHDGAPDAYATGDGLLVLAVDQPLYDGGLRRAGVRSARAEAAATGAGYRVDARDVELQIRLEYASILATEHEIRILESGVERLATYVDAIRARSGGGEGVGGDLLRASSRLANERARVSSYRRQLSELRQQFNDLIGRDPGAPLRLAPLPSPEPSPEAVPDEAWLHTPDVDRALAEQEVARWQLDQVRAERRPHLSLHADAGTQPLLGSDSGAGLNDGEGPGAALTLNLSLPLWNGGAISARSQRAELAVQRAAGEAERVRRQARLEYATARSDLRHRLDEIALRREAVPVARDSYLQAESEYRGGAGSALEVLDAFTSWLDARLAAEETLFGYRAAEARLIRWGT